MGLFEIKAYKCEWCGRIFESRNHGHDIECKYDPESRTCTSCLYDNGLTRGFNIDNIAYCPKSAELFKYPCEKRCPDYKKDPGFEAFKPKE